MVEMWCPVMTLRHIAIGHVAPIVALGLLAAVFGDRVLVVRARPPDVAGH
jgi:hypothetical protein